MCAAPAAFGGIQAADDSRLTSQYLRQEWRTQEGFPGGVVYAIAQTPDGYLWIGGEKGLTRFDGASFRLIQPTPGPRSITRVLGLLTDAQGSLWIRMQGARLIRLRNGSFQDMLPSAASPETAVTAMARGRDGSVLMATLLNGVMRHDGTRFTTLATNAVLPRSLVIAIADAPDGHVLVGTRDAGLFSLSDGRTTPLAPDRLERKINCVLPVGNRDVLIGTDNGVVRWDGQQVHRLGISALDTLQALGLLRDSAGNVWIGTAAGGLLRLSEPARAFHDAAVGSGGAVNALFEDREGNIWVGGDRGIARLRGGAFITYSSPEGLPSDGGGPIHVDQEGRTWFAPAGGGLYTLTGGRSTKVADAELQRDVVYSMAGGKGTLWVGRQRGGLTRLTMTAGTIGVASYTHADGLAQDSVYAVHQSRDGTVWAGTLSGGVSRLREGRFTTFSVADGLLSNTVSSILEAADGSMWFATPRGVSVLDRGRWRGYTVHDGLPSSDVHCLVQDSSGLVWIGTAEGLAYYGAGRVQALGDLPTRLREPILGLAADGHGALWIASATHVVQVSRTPLLGGTLTDADLREYGPADGLRSVEGVKRHRSVVTDARGRIWFSLGGGLSVFDPAARLRAAAPAIVHVQDVTADGTTVDLRGGVRIASGRQRIAFTYTGLSLSVPERVRFRYRVEGFDSDWSEPVTTREAVYANLRPGAYRFRVMASNSDGLWNGGEASLPFEIEPALWQTSWFQVSSVVAGGLLVWAGYCIRVRALARQLNVRFEERLAERTRIAQELHDTLLQGFVSASMQLDVAADRVPDDSAAKAPLGRVLQLMRQVIDEGRNAVRGLRASGDEADDLEQALLRTRRDMVQETGDFRVIVEGRPRPLHPLIRDEVYRVGREALVNAFRHAEASAVEVELDYAAEHLRVLVRDNGRGIDPEVQRAGREGHWGLSGMRERAERIGARFTVWSRAGAGTEVELLVPGHVAFPDGATWRPPGALARLFGPPRRRAVDDTTNGHDQ